MKIESISQTQTFALETFCSTGQAEELRLKRLFQLIAQSQKFAGASSGQFPWIISLRSTSLQIQTQTARHFTTLKIINCHLDSPQVAVSQRWMSLSESQQSDRKRCIKTNPSHSCGSRKADGLQFGVFTLSRRVGVNGAEDGGDKDIDHNNLVTTKNDLLLPHPSQNISCLWPIFFWYVSQCNIDTN